MGNTKEAEISAAAAAASAHEDAPPPYEAGPSTGAAAQQQEKPQPPQPRKLKFPASLSGFYKIKLGLEGYFAETKDRPLYKISWHPPQTRDNEPEHTLYDGYGDDAKQLAACRRLDHFGRQVQIILPPLLPGGSDTHSSEIMQADAGFGGKEGGGTRFRFSIEVGTDQHREDFEWRPLAKEDDHLRGDLGLERKEGGYKLVRLLSSSPPEEQEEILAVGCRAPTFASLTKSYEFRFMGSSLTGEMGERFEVCALVTAVQMWTFQFQTKWGQDPGNGGGGASRIIVV